MYNNRPLTGTTFFLRILGGVIGGITGTIIMLMIYFLSFAALPADDSAASSGITSFVLITMILLSTLSANMVSSQIIALSDKEKYQDSKTTLLHIFVLNLALFIFVTPVYLFSDPSKLQIVAAFHLLISAQMSALMMEIFAGNQYPLVGTYGVAFGGVTAFSIVSFILLSASDVESGLSTIMIFIAMPLVWGLIEFFQCIAEIIYSKVCGMYASKTEIQ